MATTQRYPSSLSQGQGGPSRRPSRHQLVYPSPSIDDEVPPLPAIAMPSTSAANGNINSRAFGDITSAIQNTATPISASGLNNPTGKAGAGGSGTAKIQSANHTLAKGRGLNPNSKPYLPKYQRSAPDLRQAAAATGAGGAPSLGAYASHAPSQAPAHTLVYPHVPYAGGMGMSAGSGQMYPDGTFVYPSIAPYPYTTAPSGYVPNATASPAQQQAQPPIQQQQRQEYSSLQHLLEQAGYAETRVHTPPAERIRQLRQQRSFVVPSSRRIKKTFDEVDVDEVRDLYSTFGLGFDMPMPSSGDEHPEQDSAYGESGTGAYDTPTKQAGNYHETQQQNHHHRVMHVTKPAIPIKSSSSVLRDVAAQDIAHQAMSPPSASSVNGSYTSRFEGTGGEHEQHWWNGFGAIGSVGARAVQAVRDLSPTKEHAAFDFSLTGSSVASGTPASTTSKGAGTSGDVGLGLAKGGQGVKKATSAFALGRQGGAGTYGGHAENYELEDPALSAAAVDTRDSLFDAPPPFGGTGASELSQGPPTLSFPSIAPMYQPQTQSQTHTQRRGAISPIVTSAPADADANAIEYAEAGLYSPLPPDYETQCEDDELFSTSFDICSEQSFGDSATSSPESAYFVLPPRQTDAEGAGSAIEDGEIAATEETEAAGVLHTTLASRIMRDAVELDDFDDSPVRTTVDLPEVADDVTTVVPEISVMSATPQTSPETHKRPAAVRACTTPIESALGLGLGDVTATQAGTVQEVRKPLKYADRAAKLRTARSTPAFTLAKAPASNAPPLPAAGAAGWFASIRGYLPLGADPGHASSSETVSDDAEDMAAAVVSDSARPKTPFRVTPALPAAPAMARAAAVVCDSTSDMAEDLPAIPAAMIPGPSATSTSPTAHTPAMAALSRKVSAARMDPQTGHATPPTADAQGQSFTVRLRPSLAKMRSMVFGPPTTNVDIPPVPALPSSSKATLAGSSADEDQSTAPMLSPRIDLAEGEAFAGWSPIKVQRGPSVGAQGEVYTPKKAVWARSSDSAVPGPAEEEDTDGYGSTVIDYTKSFFYKPCTPPAPLGKPKSKSADVNAETGEAPTDVESENTAGQAAAEASTAGASDAKLARRQRSIKSLRKALLIPVAPSVPPVPAIPAGLAGAGARAGSQGSLKGAGASGSRSSILARHSRSIASFTFTAPSFSSPSFDGSGSSSSSGQTIPQLRTPPSRPLDLPDGSAGGAGGMPEPPALAILSPGAWEAGLPPRALVLEDEDWDARRREGYGDLDGLGGQLALTNGVRKKGRGAKGKTGKVRRKGSSKSVRPE